MRPDEYLSPDPEAGEPTEGQETVRDCL